MTLVIGQTVSGYYWNKGFDARGCSRPIIEKPFKNGVIIGFTRAGSAIVSVTSGNLTFNVYRTKITEGNVL